MRFRSSVPLAPRAGRGCRRRVRGDGAAVLSRTQYAECDETISARLELSVTRQDSPSARPSSAPVSSTGQALRAPSPHKRGEGIKRAISKACSPRPACGERVPKAGEGRRRRGALSSRDASSVAVSGSSRVGSFRGPGTHCLCSPLIRPPGTFSPRAGRREKPVVIDHLCAVLVVLRLNQKGALPEHIASCARFGSWHAWKFSSMHKVQT